MVIQRFDSALRLNIHFHTLALDGMYVKDDNGGGSDGQPAGRADQRSLLFGPDEPGSGRHSRRGGSDSALEGW